VILLKWTMWWIEDEMLVRNDRLLEVMKTFFWHFHCFQKMHTIVHFKILVSPCLQLKSKQILGNENWKMCSQSKQSLTFDALSLPVICPLASRYLTTYCHIHHGIILTPCDTVNIFKLIRWCLILSQFVLKLKWFLHWII
jgi:hypothetical protein